MFCSKHVNVKRHSVYFPEINKTFAMSSLVSNLLASQIGDFFSAVPCSYGDVTFLLITVFCTVSIIRYSQQNTFSRNRICIHLRMGVGARLPGHYGATVPDHTSGKRVKIHGK